MESTLPTIESPHRIGVSISSDEGNMLILPIDEFEQPSSFSLKYLKEFGHHGDNHSNSLRRDSFHKERIQKFGYTALQGKNQRPVLYVILENSINLERNLLSALIEYKSWFAGQKLWLPLVKTDSKELTLEDDYKIVVNAINKFQKEAPTEVTIIVSLPNTQEGIQLFDKIQPNESTDSILSKSLKITIDNRINFYFSDTTWNTEDQIKRFYESNILECENNDPLDLISKIKKNDIVILKSPISSDGVDFQKITALGIVLEDSKNDSKILVDWRIKETSINIEGLDYYEPFIQKIYKYQIKYLLSKLNTKDLQTLFYNFLNNKEKIAGLVSDSSNGTDYLAIDKDVNAFARVIATKSFTPPLAISLFGKWGSGKSFFMQKLNDKINDLSRKNNFYCEGIVQIHFNAWSYMDSNLWASLVTRIFEELNIYISQNTNSKIEKDQIKKQLTDQLSITKEEVGILQNKKETVEEQIEALENTKKNLTKELNEKIEKVRTDTIWKALEVTNKEFNAEGEIRIALNNNETYKETSENLKKIIPEHYWKDPEKTYQLVKSKYTFLKEFFRKDKWLVNIIWLIGIISIIIAIPYFLEWLSITIDNINFLIPQATFSILLTLGVIWRRIETTYKQLQPFISKFWKLKEDYEEKIAETIANFKQQEKALKIEIEKKQSEILIVSEQIQKAEIIKIDLEFRITNALATETLYSFIDRRSKSDDYQKHLGIISIIRKDFEILSDLFVGHHDEIYKNTTNEDFKNKFKKPLERIILYVDDLDRCPEENVVQVLEAVNLLMAFPLFVVIVGVDSRWIKNALNKKYSLQFNSSNNQGEILVSNYLEKIFQIPFHLKEAEDKSVKEMILSLSQHKIEAQTPIITNQTLELTNDINKTSINKNDLDQIINSNLDFQTEEDSEKKDEDYYNENFESNNFGPEDLILTDYEIQLMQNMSEIIGNNPRSIKRFVNTFRIIKAHEEFDSFSPSYDQEIIAILFLIALPLGRYKELAPSFEKLIDSIPNIYKQTKHYFQHTSDSNGHPNLNDKLIPLRDELFKILSRENHTTLLNMRIDIFRNHNKFIRRFTFSQIIE